MSNCSIWGLVWSMRCGSPNKLHQFVCILLQVCTMWGWEEGWLPALWSIHEGERVWKTTATRLPCKMMVGMRLLCTLCYQELITKTCGERKEKYCAKHIHPHTCGDGTATFLLQFELTDLLLCCALCKHGFGVELASGSPYP